MRKESIVFENGIQLESGKIIAPFELAYHTYGELNNQRDNVVWVFHALTANSDVGDWWSGLFESGVLDPETDFIICVNVLGSFYGTTGPRSINPITNEPYGFAFPFFTVRDVVNTQFKLAMQLNINNIKLLIGGSFGGYQSLEFAYAYTGSIDQMVLVAANAKETAWSIAVHESQRLALMADSSLKDNLDSAGEQGLMAARGIGLLTYRTFDSYVAHQSDTDERVADFKASSYIKYQGAKLTNRFNAQCYWHLINCLDSHNIGRGRGGIEKALSQIDVNTTIIGISSDRLIPLSEQQLIAKHLPSATMHVIESEYGHDGFLVETEKMSKIILKVQSLKQKVG